MLPNGFPNKAPYVRIINRSTEFHVDDFYKDVRSPTDPKSFILNEKLAEIKSWDRSKSLVSVIIESQDLMRNHFPFAKKKSESGGFNSQYSGGNSVNTFLN